MNERNKEFLAFYQQYRYQDQQKFYESRLEEFEAARDQAITLTVSFMALAAVSAVLASADVAGLKALWAVLAVVFPVLSTTIAAYSSLYAYERQAKLYQDAISALDRVGADSPNLRQGLGEADYHQMLIEYINEVEDILRTEQGQWGMLSKEIKPAEPPLPES